MDDRKKLISELEQRKREQMSLLDSLLARLGEAIVGRASGNFQEDDAAFGELALYRRLCNDIADSEVSIQAVEDQIRRFKELEENIAVKEQEDSDSSQELSVMYGQLGKLLLDVSANTGEGERANDAGYADFCAPYRDNADALLTKVLSLEERLSGVEQKGGGNVFTWIGKNAQSLVLRSFLTKAQENLEQLRRTVGERYSRQNIAAVTDGEAGSNQLSSDTPEILYLCVEIERQRAELASISQELADLREAKNAISTSYDADGGPLKRIQVLKNNIAHIRDELKLLYKKVGADAAAINTSGEITVERRLLLDTLLMPEDRDALDNAARASSMIREDETAIEKLQIALAIDEEKVKIEKLRRMIQDKREKIAHAERNIMEYERGIRDSETTIQKLQERE